MLRFALSRQLPSLIEPPGNMFRQSLLFPVLPRLQEPSADRKDFLADTCLGDTADEDTGGAYAYSYKSVTTFGPEGQKNMTTRRFRDGSGRDKTETMKSLRASPEADAVTFRTLRDGERNESSFEGVQSEAEFAQKWAPSPTDPLPGEQLDPSASMEDDEAAREEGANAASANPAVEDDIDGLRRRALALRRLKASRYQEAKVEAERQRLRREIAELENELEL